MRRIVWLSLAAVVLIVAPSAPALDTLEQRVDRSIVHLDNGLVVIAQRTPAAPVVSVQCWVKTGSVFEQQHNGAGLSHFLEHLVSGGTTSTRTEDQSSAILGRIGAQTNAATSLDTVRYYINTAAEHSETAIDLLSDWMANSVIDPDEYARERDVIQREFEMGRGEANRIFWKLTQQARYREHPARHPIIGYLDEFLTVSRDEIHDFYKTMYVPNNMVFVVAGDIDPREAVEQVAERWRDEPRGALPAVGLPDEPARSHIAPLAGEADITRPRLRLAWPGVRLTAEHDYALDLLAQVLGQGELSRLVQSVRDDAQLVTSIDAFNWSMWWGQGLFAVDAVVREGRIDEAREAIMQQVARVRDEGVTDEELDRAKAKTLASAVYSAQSAQGTAERIARDFIATGDPDYLDRYAQAVQALTPGDLRAAAQAILEPEHVIEVRLEPADGEMEQLARPELPERRYEDRPIDLDNRAWVARYRELAASSDAPAAPTVTPMTMHTLRNGLRVLIQRDDRLPVVAMQWYQLGGLLADTPGREGVANAAAQMMIKGAAARTADDIARALESTGSKLSTGCGNNTTLTTALSLTQHWKRTARLMADVVTAPTFPADEWDLMKPRLLAEIDAINDRWSSQLFSTFERTYFGDHPWSQMPVGRRDVVESLDPNDLKQFHRTRLHPGQSVLAIVGDVDVDEAKTLAAELFGAIPFNPELEFDAAAPAPAEPAVHVERIAKPLTAVQIGFGPAVTRDSDDYPAMLVLNRIVSSFPSGWIHQALRGEGPGLVYAAFAFQRTGVVPGYWAMAFNTSAASAPEAIDRAMGVARRLRSEPVDNATLQRAISAALVGELMGRQTVAQRATAASLDELYGVGYDDRDRLVERIRTTTADQVQAIARRVVNRPVMVILSEKPFDREVVEQLEQHVRQTPQAPAPASSPED